MPGKSNFFKAWQGSWILAVNSSLGKILTAGIEIPGIIFKQFLGLKRLFLV